MFKKPTRPAGMRRIFCSLLPVLFLAGQALLSQAVRTEPLSEGWGLLDDPEALWNQYEQPQPGPCPDGTVPEKTAVQISGKSLRQDCNEQGDWGYWPEENLPRRNVALLPHGGTVIVNQYRSPEGHRYRFDNRSTDAQQNHPIPLATEEEFRAFLENIPPQVDYVSVCEVPEDAFDCLVLLAPWLYCEDGTSWDWGSRSCQRRRPCKYYEYWSEEHKLCIVDLSALDEVLRRGFDACGFSCLP